MRNLPGWYTGEFEQDEIHDFIMGKVCCIVVGVA